MFPRFFGGEIPILKDSVICCSSSGPFGDFGYGGRFAGHSPDFFPPGHMGFIPPHPGLVPGMEQPLPMTGSLNQDQYPDTKPVMADMPFNMSGKMMSDGGFSLANMQTDMRDMISHQQDFSSSGEREAVPPDKLNLFET